MQFKPRFYNRRKPQRRRRNRINHTIKM